MRSKQEIHFTRASRIRKKVRALGERPVLSVYRSSKHIYAQLLTPDGSKVMASASTVCLELREETKGLCGVEKAKRVGSALAKKCIKLGVSQIAFDRSGYKFHGKVKALADSARAEGLDF